MRAAVMLLLIGAAAVSAAPHSIARMFATGTAATAGYPSISGTVTFEDAGSGLTTIYVNVTGFAPNSQHSMHVHVNGDITSPDGLAAGGHFNPNGTAHGCYPATDRHAGDIGNFTVDAAGAYVGSFTRDLLVFTAGPSSVIGRALIMHALPDDCGQPTGNAGGRLAHGIIGIAQTATSAQAIAPSTTGTILVARLTPTAVYGGSASGFVYIRADPNDATKLQVYVNATGVAPASALHGFHVHAYGDWSDLNGATSAGGHWNPASNSHALPSESATRHAGDFGNVCADSTGYVSASLSIDVANGLSLATLAGHAVVLHASKDEGQSAQPTGNAGNRLAMGVLGIGGSTVTFWPATTAASTGCNSNAASGVAAPAALSVAALVVAAAALACRQL